MGQSTTQFSCSPTDISCLCFAPEFPLLVGECLGRSCDKSDQPSAVAFGEAVSFPSLSPSEEVTDEVVRIVLRNDWSDHYCPDSWSG